MLDKLEGKLSYMVNLILNIIKIFTDSSFIYDGKREKRNGQKMFG